MNKDKLKCPKCDSRDIKRFIPCDSRDEYVRIEKKDEVYYVDIYDCWNCGCTIGVTFGIVDVEDCTDYDNEI